MRPYAALLLALCLTTHSGCMIMDEIDSANAKMQKQAKKKTPETPAASPAPGAPQPRSALLEQSKQWWENAKSLSPADEPSASIVSCRLPGGTQFMSRDDCLTRGGRPGGRS